MKIKYETHVTSNGFVTLACPVCHRVLFSGYKLKPDECFYSTCVYCGKKSEVIRVEENNHLSV